MIDLKTLAAGDILVAVMDMGCTHLGQRYTLKGDADNGFYIMCDAGTHSLCTSDERCFEKYVPMSAIEQYIDRELGRVDGETL